MRKANSNSASEKMPNREARWRKRLPRAPKNKEAASRNIRGMPLLAYPKMTH
jgi:hypothetical protein